MQFEEIPFSASMLADESLSPDYVFSRQERVCIIEQAKLSCTPQQRLLVDLHYGDTDLTLTQIAELFDVTRSAVIQMHNLAVLNLRRSMARMGIRKTAHV